MFFLLASFMLVSMSMIKLQKIETKLPSKNSAPPDPNIKPNFVAIGIDKTGAIYFDKDPTPILAGRRSLGGCSRSMPSRGMKPRSSSTATRTLLTTNAGRRFGRRQAGRHQEGQFRGEK